MTATTVFLKFDYLPFSVASCIRNTFMTSYYDLDRKVMHFTKGLKQSHVLVTINYEWHE